MNIYLLLIHFILMYSVLHIIYKSYDSYDVIESSYYKSNKPRGTLNSVLKKNNIVYADLKHSKLYIPSNYKTVENELKRLNTNDTPEYIYAIKGCDSIVSKDNIWKLLVKRYGMKKASTIMPESHVLYSKKDIGLFTSNFNSKANYILKKNIQRKQGLKLTNNLKDILNSSSDGYKIVQRYIKDVFLVNKRKLNIRIYLLIVCKNNNIYAYTTSCGKCLYTNKDYDRNVIDFESNITSFNTDLSIYDKNPLTLEEFKKYIEKERNINSKKLFKNINLKLKLLMDAVYPSLSTLKSLKNKTTFQLFGLDILLTKDLEPYILEANKGPSMQGKLQKDIEQYVKIQEDVLKTVNILPSRKNSFYMIWNKKV